MNSLAPGGAGPLATDVMTVLTRAAAHRAGIDSARYENGVSARMPYAHAMAIWSAIDAADRSGTLGVQLAHELSTGSMGVVGYVAASSPTVAAALSRVARYHRLIKDETEFESGFGPDGYRVMERPPLGHHWPAVLAEAVLGAYVVFLRRFTGHTALTPRAVAFQHAPKPLHADHHALFGTQIDFAAPHQRLLLERADAERALLSADPALLELLVPVAEEHLAKLITREPWLAELRKHIAFALPDGSPALEAMARSIGMSVRSLQRKLSGLGLSYQQLLDEVRRRRALELLAAEVSVDEVAFLLGFADASGLRRAMRRWTGNPPRAAREELRGAGLRAAR